MQCRRSSFDPWVRKIPWRRKWQPISYSLLGSSMDRGSWPSTVFGITRVRHNLETKPPPYLYLFICTHMHTRIQRNLLQELAHVIMETEKSYNLTICYLQSLPEISSQTHPEIKCHLIPGHLLTQSSGHIQLIIKLPFGASQVVEKIGTERLSL